MIVHCRAPCTHTPSHLGHFIIPAHLLECFWVGGQSQGHIKNNTETLFLEILKGFIPSAIVYRFVNAETQLKSVCEVISYISNMCILKDV